MVLFSISGSLRLESSNTKILQTMKSLCPSGHEFIIHPGVDELPFYNPDLDGESVPVQVKELRGMINRSHAIVISTPEYAHGIPGALKNALDWLVSTTVLENKPVAIVLGSSSEGIFAKEALVEVLKTMNAKIVPELVHTVHSVRLKSDTPELWQEMKDLVENLILYSQMKS